MQNEVDHSEQNGREKFNTSNQNKKAEQQNKYQGGGTKQPWLLRADAPFSLTELLER